MYDRRTAIDTLRAEGLDVTEWHDDAGTSYDEHAHPYREVRIVLRGSITFVLTDGDVTLGPGDRLDLAAGRRHAAKVGPEGVHYIAGTGR